MRNTYYRSGFRQDPDHSSLIIGGAVGLLMLIFGVIMYDCVGLETKVGIGSVSDKHFAPAHTTWVWISHGKRGGHPQAIYHPDRWSVEVEIRGDSDWLDVSNIRYETTKRGQSVCAHYGIGRLFGGVHVYEIEEIEGQVSRRDD